MTTEIKRKAQACERARRYYAVHREEVLEQRRVKRELRGPPTEEERAAWREDSRKYRERHPEELKKRRREYFKNRVFTEEEKAAIRIYNRVASKRYRESHHEEIRQRLAIRRAAQRLAEAGQ